METRGGTNLNRLFSEPAEPIRLIDGQQHNECKTDAYQYIGAESGGVLIQLSLKTDNSSEHKRENKP